METEEDHAALLRDTLEGCDIETDLDTIDRIGESLKLLQQDRNNKVHTTQYELKQLSEKLAEKQEIYDSLVNSKQRDELKSKIKQGQNSELELKKNLKELNSSKQDLSTQLSNLIDEFNDLDKQIEELDLISEDDDKDAAMYVSDFTTVLETERLTLNLD